MDNFVEIEKVVVSQDNASGAARLTKQIFIGHSVFAFKALRAPSSTIFPGKIKSLNAILITLVTILNLLLCLCFACKENLEINRESLVF